MILNTFDLGNHIRLRIQRQRGDALLALLDDVGRLHRCWMFFLQTKKCFFGRNRVGLRVPGENVHSGRDLVGLDKLLHSLELSREDAFLVTRLLEIDGLTSRQLLHSEVPHWLRIFIVTSDDGCIGPTTLDTIVEHAITYIG